MSTMNIRQIAVTIQNTKRAYSQPLCSKELFEGEPFIIEDAENSTTGRHGSAKCNFRYRLLFNQRSSQKIVPSDTKVTSWMNSPDIEAKEGIVVEKNPVIAKDMETFEEIEIKVVKESMPIKLNDKIKYYIWHSPTGEVPFYYG